MTRWKTLAELGGQPSTGTGVSIGSGAIGVETSPAITLTHDKIVYYHELCLRMAMLYAASQPYDWGAPRPTQRPLFTDYPLIEYDLDPANTVIGPIALAGENAEQWRPVTARPVRNIGRSYSFPNTPIPATTWGNSAHFTLAKPFVAAERGFIDDVIMPHTSRKRIARAFASLRNKKIQTLPKKHDTMPL